MKTIQWPLRAFLFVGILQVISCTKTIDSVNNDSVSVETSSDLTFPVANEFADCKLRNIFHEHPGISDVTVNGLFTYNKGNPISLTYNMNGTLNPNHYFYYDKQGRLKEWRGTEHPDMDERFAEWRHLYGYDANNRIITDTLYKNISFGPSVMRVYVTTLTYDDQGRIVKENIRNIAAPPGQPLETTRNPTYTYDSRGNLAVKGWKSSSYDNKVSIFRTHPVFQFIFRNYSRNNAAPQAKYNSKGLPLSVNPINDAFFNANPIEDNGNVIDKIFYDCQ